MHFIRRGAACVGSLGAMALMVTAATATLFALAPEVLPSIGAVPAHLAGSFNTPLAWHVLPDGSAYVFDRREHTVYRIDAARTAVTPLVQIGAEAGRLLQPSAFDSAPDGSFVVADAPRNKARIQVFHRDGFRLSGFELTIMALPRITLETFVLNGIGSLCYTGRTILISQPETGALITEYDVWGRALRSLGRLRKTGHEGDEALHLAFNSGVPLAIPQGGFYFVFQSGEPMFQRYDAAGKLLYERRIQGRELDALLAQQPTQWPRREIAGNEIPLVSPTIRTARVDPDGRLWVSLILPFTYVYDADGDKLRTLQFRAAGLVAPTSFFFRGTSSGGTRLLVTPGLFEFDVSRPEASR